VGGVPWKGNENHRTNNKEKDSAILTWMPFWPTFLHIPRKCMQKKGMYLLIIPVVLYTFDHILLKFSSNVLDTNFMSTLEIIRFAFFSKIFLVRI